MVQFIIKLNEAISNEEQLIKILFFESNILIGTNIIIKNNNNAIIIFEISIINFQHNNNF